MAERTGKNHALTIRLIESAVFLQPGGTNSLSRSRDSRPSLLRGLLVLDLPKPTRIKSIELELIGKTLNSWPEGKCDRNPESMAANVIYRTGVGAESGEMTEEHDIYRVSTVYFRAQRLETRRGSSLGPGPVDDLERTPSYTLRDHYDVEDPLRVRGRPVRPLSVGNSSFNPVSVSHEEFPGTSTLPFSPNLPTSLVSPTISEIPPTPPPIAVKDFFQSLDFALRSNRSE